MRPYIGILIDSFWEAVSNKVLWALLVTSTFILVALAPFGLIVEQSFQFGTYDVYDQQRLVTKLSRGLDRRGSVGVAAIAQRLEPALAEKIRREGQQRDGSVSLSELVAELNRLILLPDLYSESAFPTAARRERLKPLIDQISTGLMQEELQQLNSELLQISLAPELGPPRGEQIWVGYAGFKIGSPLAITQRQIKTYIEPLILQLVVQLGLGVMIVFIAVIVTSPIIPDTFRSGALHLMLSKPISRTWLFLSKFAGGCIFVSLNLVYVLVGLYLIVGVRFGIWNKGLLACIPLLLFVYIIFYSVSALAGLIWGNAIVSVVTCIVFWAFCFTLGTMHGIMQERVEQWPLINRVQEVADQIVIVNEAGVVSAWNSDYSIWQPATEFSIRAEGSTSTTFGPFHDQQRGLMLVKTFTAFNPFENVRSQRSRALTLIPLDEANDPPNDLAQVRETARWNTLPGPEIPEQVFRIIELDQQLIIVSRLGLYRITFDRAASWKGSNRSFFGLPALGAFEEVAPRGFRLTDNTTAARAGVDQLLVYTSGNLTRMKWEANRFQVVAECKLNVDGSEAALLAANEKYCIAALDNQPIFVLDEQLNAVAEIDLPKGEMPKQLGLIPNCHDVAILTHTGKLLILDTAQLVLYEVKPPVNQKITCMTWKDREQVWFGVAPNTACLVDLSNGKILRRLSPTPKTSEKFYNRLVAPLYRYNPKPSALNESMRYLLTGSTTFDPQLITVKLDTAKVELDVWQPIVSNSVFVAIMLLVSCLYLARKEY